MEFIKSSVNTDMNTKNVKFLELSVATVFFKTQILKMI